MTIELPAGYLTRPEAARQFNRSQRALERDLNVALTIRDKELLSHWKLATQDGKVRDGATVTGEVVKDLVTAGMTPAWCIAEKYLEEKYGRKGESRPVPNDQRPRSDYATERVATERRSLQSDQLPDETVFLKDLVRTLQQEKQEERERHDRIVAKLFGELDVKNRQISAWDEVTQGLTKALATGQIAPNMRYLLPRNEQPDAEAEKKVEDAAVVDDRADAGVDVKESKTQRSPVQSREQKSEEPKGNTPNGARSKKRKSQAEKKPEKRPEKKSENRKPKWNEFPTLKRLFSRDE